MLIATTMELVTTAVHIFKMQEYYVNKVVNKIVIICYALVIVGSHRWDAG